MSTPSRKKIVLPTLGRSMSDFVKEVAAAINELIEQPQSQCRVCVRHGLTGKLAAREMKDYFSCLEFHPISAPAAVTELERYVEFVTATSVTKSLSQRDASALLASPDLKDALYHLDRILEFPIPMRQSNGTISMPTEGFGFDGARHAFYCGKPIEHEVSLAEAKSTLEYVFREFRFDPAHPRSRVHAIARLLTPYCQGIMGFSARSPLWVFQANRPRSGKDYCAAVGPLVFGGYAHEDAPLERDDAENKRRITAAIISGHRFMHFANCKVDLDQCESLEAAVTAKFWRDRLIGTSESKIMPNEIIYSLSFNGDLRVSPDIALRTRRIKLFLDPSIANPNELSYGDLHGWLASPKGRRKVIAALAALVRHWKGIAPKDRPKPPFTSFPEWGEVVGGIMIACGLGNPCETDPEDFQNVVRTWRDDLLALTGMIGREQPAAWLKTSDILADYVTKYPHTFPVMSRYSPEGLPAELGRKLKQHARKDLGGGFKILVDDNDESRPKFQFVVPKPAAT